MWKRGSLSRLIRRRASQFPGPDSTNMAAWKAAGARSPLLEVVTWHCPPFLSGEVGRRVSLHTLQMALIKNIVYHVWAQFYGKQYK
jgi:hypothetical protein